MPAKLSAELESLKTLLAELVDVPAPTSHEEPMMRWLRDKFGEFADQVEVDLRGNVHGTFKGAGESPLRYMLASHMDTLGFLVKSIDQKGFIRFAGGGLRLALSSKRLWIHGSKGPVLGVIGMRVGYGTSTLEQMITAPTEKEMYIDVGAGCPEEVAEMGIQIGDPITYDGGLGTLGEPHHVVSPGLDDRAGVAALVTLAPQIKSINPRPEVILVGTIEEEFGLRGAGTAAFKVRPDLGVSVDTQPAGGTPEYSFDMFPVVIGKGPVIKFTENARITNHPRVRQLLIDAAEKSGTPYQRAAAPPGGSDMGAIEQTAAGIPAAALGMPRRYAHSPNEVIDLRDLMGMVTILNETISILGPGYDLNRI